MCMTIKAINMMQMDDIQDSYLTKRQWLYLNQQSMAYYYLDIT